MRRFLPLLGLAISVGCGSSTPEAASPVVDAEAEATAAAAANAAGPAQAAKVEIDAAKSFGEIPTDCAEHKDNLCLPPTKFVKRLCSAPYPNVALSMFHKATPWTRGYLRMNVEAWNASGGLSSSDKLVFDEEVLVLNKRVAASGAMRVSGASGGYEVLRWDGSCASLNEEELTLKAPPKAKFARIPYRSLDEAIRTALEANEKVGKAVEDRRKECQGAAMGSDPGPKCAKAEEAVSGTVVDYVRAGGTLPAPTRLP